MNLGQIVPFPSRAPGGTEAVTTATSMVNMELILPVASFGTTGVAINIHWLELR